MTLACSFKKMFKRYKKKRCKVRRSVLIVLQGMKIKAYTHSHTEETPKLLSHRNNRYTQSIL